MPDGTGFACSMRKFSPLVKTYFAAINLPQWNEGLSCGKCIRARCTDSMCKNNQWIKAMIVDQCPECKEGDVDFSIPAYNELTGLWPHRLQIEWEWLDTCDDLVEGEIHIAPKDGVNAWFHAFYLSNSKMPIKSVTLDGKLLERNQFGFFSAYGDIGAGPWTLKIEGETGETVTSTISSFSEASLGVQFSGSGGSALNAIVQAFEGPSSE